MIRDRVTGETFHGARNLDARKVEALYLSGIWTDEDLESHGLEYTPDPEPPPERPMVAKSVVQDRVIAAGKASEAYALLQQQPEYLFRWLAPDKPRVYCDDPDSVMLVAALGMDPAVILAPEGGD